MPAISYEDCPAISRHKDIGLYYEVILKRRGILWSRCCGLATPLNDNVLLHTDIFKSDAMIIKTLSNGFHHFLKGSEHNRAFMGRPGVQSAR